MTVYEFSFFDFSYWTFSIRLFLFFSAAYILYPLLVNLGVFAKEYRYVQPTILSVGIVIMTIVFSLQLKPCLELSSGIKQKNYDVVEGVLVVIEHGGHGTGQNEIIQIGETQFGYHSHQSSRPGYHKYVKENDKLNENMVVRVTHLKGQIIRIEKL
jgi:hypothetical protein